ncbi:MAG: ATP-binding protein [Candidatus Methanomethylicia archaeon]
MDLKRYLIDKKSDIGLLTVKERAVNFQINRNFIVSVIGPRRAGKTYSIYDLIKNKMGLQDRDFLFINFEDEGITSLSREEILNSVFYHQEIYGNEPNFLFFDEVQAFNNWEKIVYTLFEKKKYNIFITGSSSKLLSKEIATQLRGRCISFLILPLSFSEVVRLRGLKIDKFLTTSEESKLKNLLSLHLLKGGFPDIVLNEVDPKKFFKEYMDLVAFRDIVERFGVRNIFVIRYLMTSILSSFSKEFSINRNYEILKEKGVKVSRKTLYSYSQLFEDAFFCFYLSKFEPSLRREFLSLKKVYLCDSGLASLLAREEKGRLMENTTFLELKRRQNENPLLEIYYWKDYQQREVDFVVKEGLKIKQLIQVTYASSRDEVEKREIKALIKASEQLKCKNLLIITWDYEDEIRVNEGKIRFTPLWKWLLSME